MNLLILMPEIAWGGAERQFRYLIEKIDVSGIVVICPHIYSDKSSAIGRSSSLLQRKISLIESDVPCRGKVKSILFYLREITKLLKTEKISAAIVYDAYGCGIIPYLKMKGIKVIYAERNSGEGVIQSRILKKYVSMADVITTNSTDAEKVMKTCFKQDVYFIKNGIQEVPALETNNIVQTIVVPARIAKIKNQKLVLQFLFNCKNFTGKVIFAGKIEDKEYYSDLLKFVETYRLQDRVEFKGFVSRMDELYCVADIVILPSYVEGMSNTILECFMRKIPILVSNISMNLITENLVNWSFSPDSSEELEQSFLRWINLDANQKEMVLEQNRNYVITEHSVEKMVSSYQKIIEEITGK